MNKLTLVIVLVVLISITGISYAWNQTAKTKSMSPTEVKNSDEIISMTGIHWHPELAIYIKGEKQTIPANTGIGMQYAEHPLYDSMMMMTNMHTHDNSGKIHWEVMEGPVKKYDVTLGNFFSVWGQKFNENCILEYCNGSEGSVKMFVNGQENTDFENYQIKDGDKIEIKYE